MIFLKFFVFEMKRLKLNLWTCQNTGQYYQTTSIFVLPYFFYIVFFCISYVWFYTWLNATNLYKLHMFVHMQTHTQKKRIDEIRTRTPKKAGIEGKIEEWLWSGKQVAHELDLTHKSMLFELYNIEKNSNLN